MYLGDLGKGKKWGGRLKKLGKTAVRAVAAYYTGGASEAYLAQRKAAKGGGGAPEFLPPPPPEASPAAAISTAAQSYFASRSPRPTPQPSSYAVDEDAEAAEAGPRASAAGFMVGGMKIPPALLMAGVALPLLFIVLRPARGRR